MQYQLKITLTEEDYLTYNLFHSLESKQGKSMVNRSRNLFIALMVVILVLYVVVVEGHPLTVVIIGLLTLVYSLLFKKAIARSIKTQIKRMKKTGKLPYDQEVTFEFYEDKLVEITSSQRIEQSYAGIEQACVNGDRYLYLYRNSTGAYLLPLAQIRAQVPSEQFMKFLFQRISTVEYY